MRPTVRDLSLLVLLCLAGAVYAEEPIRLKESFAPDYEYRVSSRVELTGQLTLPPTDKDKKPTTLPIVGTSAIDYDERVLSVKDGIVDKTVRNYKRMDFDRKIGDQPQKTTLRPEVRRLVVLRNKNTAVPFCPEGPLLWAEIDLVRTDVFTPALAGLLPEKAVNPGDHWTATVAAVQALTDLERIDEGQIECKFEGLAIVEKRRHARVSLSGTVKGTNEDGPNRQKFDGYFYFDLESNHLSYLSLHGISSLLDKDGNEAGRVEGKFVVTRQANTTAKELSATALKGVSLEPDADNTLLLYDNPELGVRFLYPRRWRLAGGVGRRIQLDAKDGSGLIVALDPPANVPTAVQFLRESRDFFEKQKAKVLRFDEPVRLKTTVGSLDHFTVEVEIKGQRQLMDYYVTAQKDGGATLAASLPVGAEGAAMQKEIERMARSLTVTKAIK